MLFFWMLGIRSKFSPGEIHTHASAWCTWTCECTHAHTHMQIYIYAYCLGKDKVELFQSASYFPVCSWKMSQGSLQLSVLSTDGSLKGRLDVSSRQGHQTDNDGWKWWWQEKKRGRKKIAGVTASTCFTQLSDPQAPQRKGRKKKESEEKETHTFTAQLLYKTSHHRRQHEAAEVTVSSQCHVAGSLFGSSQHTLILWYSPWSPATSACTQSLRTSAFLWVWL